MILFLHFIFLSFLSQMSSISFLFLVLFDIIGITITIANIVNRNIIDITKKKGKTTTDITNNTNTNTYINKIRKIVIFYNYTIYFS